VNGSPKVGGITSKSGFKDVRTNGTIARMKTKMDTTTRQGKTALVTGASRGIGRSASEKPKTSAVPVTSGFVASAQDRAGCKAAASILEKNLVHYNTRDKAIQAGKKPCGECRP